LFFIDFYKYFVPKGQVLAKSRKKYFLSGIFRQ